MMESTSAGRPAHMMGFADAAKTCMQKSFTLQGRASRSEYWWFYLVFFIAYLGLMFVSLALEMPLNIVVLLMVPAIFCAGIRRMHDLGKSGWWILIGLIPLIGGLIVLYWYVSEGEDVANDYGEVPTNTVE